MQAGLPAVQLPGLVCTVREEREVDVSAQDGRSGKSASPCPEGHPHFWDHGCSRVSCYLVQVRIAADPNLWKALLLLQ